MSALEIFQHDGVRIALAVGVVFMAFWVLKKLLRSAIILMAVGYFVWHFWLA